MFQIFELFQLYKLFQMFQNCSKYVQLQTKVKMFSVAAPTVTSTAAPRRIKLFKQKLKSKFIHYEHKIYS